MKTVGLVLLGLVGVIFGAPAEEPTDSAAKASISISTPNFKALGDRIKNIVKQPHEIAKDSVDLVKDSVKMGTGIGEAAITKGTELATQGVSAAADLTKMGIHMGTNIADKTLGIVGKVGNMIPIAGQVVTAGAGLGQSGVNGIKSIGDSILDSIKSWIGGGLGMVSNTAKQGNKLFGTAADTIGSAVNSGIDMKGEAVGNVIAAGLNRLPEVKITADVNLG